MSSAFESLSVFVDGPGGGNAVPVVRDADHLSEKQMQAFAQETGLESVFVLRAEESDCTARLRYWVPNHEMAMCGHATIGAAWLLHRLGLEQPEDGYLFSTASGEVRAGADEESGWFEQSSVGIEAVAPGPVLRALGLATADLAGAVLNSAAPRVKTLIPLGSAAAGHALDPDAAAVEAACEASGSTGLYPYALSNPELADARQFPKASGYREDPATGIAAAALFFGLNTGGSSARHRLEVRQGLAMGRPSKILVQAVSADDAVSRCRVSGRVVRES